MGGGLCLLTENGITERDKNERQRENESDRKTVTRTRGPRTDRSWTVGANRLRRKGFRN